MGRILIKSSAIILSVLLIWIKISESALPSSITTCPRNHPDPKSCIVDAVEKVRPLLASGDLGDGYKTLPLEPLHLETIEMSQGTEFVAKLIEIQATGGSNFTIEKLKVNIPKLVFDFTVFLPQIDFQGKYTMNIKLLLFNINGDGTVRGTLSNSRAMVKMRGRTVLKDGVEYVKFDKLPLRIQVDNLSIHMDNLFGGDPVLGKIGNAIVNDNSKLFLQEILPGLEKSLSASFLEIANNILETATFDEMFPPST